MSQAPLSWASSAEAGHASVAPSLPEQVVNCLQNTRFLHLATCADEQPHVSLMNYTYLPRTPFAPHPVVVMTTNRESRKTANLARNPRVSLLVHDWVSQRTGGPERRSQSPAATGAAAGAAGAPTTGLAALLAGLNTAALARISVTLGGAARVLAPGSDEERYCLDQHVRHYAAEEGIDDVSDVRALAGADVQVVSVRIEGGRIADWKGGLQDFVVGPAAEEAAPTTNGL